MPDSCRSALAPLYENNFSPPGSNAGLLLARYLREQKQEGNNEGEKAREELLDAAIAAVNNVKSDATGFYKSAFDRRGKSLGGTTGAFRVTGRLIIGLGTHNVLETGLTLNHIYGTPLIPGSALKGLAAHYCSSVWGASDPDFKGPIRDQKGKIVTPAGKHYDFMFGSTEDAGFLTFNDAWITPSTLLGSLSRDVMTPHHGDYYMESGTNAPTDFDDPNPVTFLSVRGDFEIRVSCESGEDAEEKGKNWEALAMELLKQALEKWGVGGKTSSGYGLGTLDYKCASSPLPVQALFTPGQQVEAIYRDLNKKGNPQIEVESGGEKIKATINPATWKGPKLAKGEKFMALVESYNPNSTPPLTLRATD
jgi:CRISPR-associated protein Cmr6